MSIKLKVHPQLGGPKSRTVFMRILKWPWNLRPYTYSFSFSFTVWKWKSRRIVYFQIKNSVISAHDLVLFANDASLSVNDFKSSVKIVYFQPRSYTFSYHDLWSYTLARSCNLTEDLLISQEKLQDCKEELHTENNEKQVLQRKLNLVCGLGPSWSGWSSCSKTCWGIKTRIDRCSNSDEQIKSCNQYSSCPRSGK